MFPNTPWPSLLSWHCRCMLSLSPFHHHQCCSTCHPPHKQLLMGLEAGGVTCGCWCWHCCWVIVVGSWGHHGGALVLIPHHCQCLLSFTHYPTCKQGLATVGVGRGCHPLHVPPCLPLFVCPIVLSCTHSHPMSSCSWRWSWVLTWWLCGCGVVWCCPVVVVVVIISSDIIMK